jgi:hypothetical protein
MDISKILYRIIPFAFIPPHPFLPPLEDEWKTSVLAFKGGWFSPTMESNRGRGHPRGQPQGIAGTMFPPLRGHSSSSLRIRANSRSPLHKSLFFSFLLLYPYVFRSFSLRPRCRGEACLAPTVYGSKSGMGFILFRLFCGWRGCRRPPHPDPLPEGEGINCSCGFCQTLRGRFFWRAITQGCPYNSIQPSTGSPTRGNHDGLRIQ